MRPASIVIFERLFLASLALSVVNFIIGYDAAANELAREPALAQIGLGTEILIGMMVVTTAIYLLLWFLIARKASNVAKWFLVVFTALGAATFLSSLAALGLRTDLNVLLSLAYYALAVAAVVFLFKPDAVGWLRGERHADPAAFD